MPSFYESFANAWAADATLQAALPSTALTTETSENPPARYAVWTRVAETVASRSRKRRVWEEAMDLTIYAETVAIARSIRDKVEEVFDERYRPTLDNGTCVGWRVMNASRQREEGGHGSATISFVMKRSKARS